MKTILLIICAFILWDIDVQVSHIRCDAHFDARACGIVKEKPDAQNTP